MRILVVDDSLPLRKLILRTVAPYGECSAVVNGEEAVRAFGEGHAEGRPFDLVCLDIYMPVMNGLDALAEIRDLERQADIPADKRLRIVMSTTTTEVKDLQEALRRGADAFLPKPYTREAFHAQLKTLGMIPADQPVPTEPPAPVLPKGA